MADEYNHTLSNNQLTYDDENDFELSHGSENEGSLHFLNESGVDSDITPANQHTGTGNFYSTPPFVDTYDILSTDHYTADLRQPLPSGKQPLARRTRSSRSRASQDFDIFDDSDGPEHNHHGRSYYGSSVPALGPVFNESPFCYQLDIILTRALATQRNLGFMPKDYHTVTLEERVLKYYEWNLLEDHLDVWLWVESEGLARNWTKQQASGFRKILLQLRRITILNANYHRQSGSQFLGDCSRYIEAQINALGIENISLSCPAPYIFRFRPTGDDTPKYQRSDFDAVDQKRMDRQFPQNWAEGEECIENPDTLLPRPSGLTWREKVLAAVNEYPVNFENMDETEHANVRDFLDQTSWEHAMQLRMRFILCGEVVLPVV